MLPAGLAVRMPASFLVMYGAGYTWKEKLFFAFAWTPKVRSRKCCQPLLEFRSLKLLV